MHFVIGIDGGGSKTILKVADLKSNLLGIYEGGPSNINSNDIDKVQNTLYNLVRHAMSDMGFNQDDCQSVCIGAAGAGRPAERDVYYSMINTMFPNCHVNITHDAETALYGGIGGGVGLVVIAGTGSICFGKNDRGITARAGGWGHIIGDEGSGYYIGREILAAVVKSFDGRQRPTALSAMVLEHLKLADEQQLVDYVYRSGAGKKEIAALAPIADVACALGDEVACEILQRAVFELCICVRTVVEKLQLGVMGTRVDLAVSGSILLKSSFVKEKFEHMIKNDFHYMEIHPSLFDGAWGAVLIALENIHR